MSGSLPWNFSIADIPFDIPVLVRERAEAVPFMAVRNSDFEPDSVSYLLGPSADAYGVYVELTRLEAWLSVT